MATVATTTAEKSDRRKDDRGEKGPTDEKPERKPQRARVDDRFKIFCGRPTRRLCDEVCNFLA